MTDTEKDKQGFEAWDCDQLKAHLDKALDPLKELISGSGYIPTIILRYPNDSQDSIIWSQDDLNEVIGVTKAIKDRKHYAGCGCGEKHDKIGTH